jgi:ABC-type branched-subunit amino acid transport system ATPase component
MKTGVRKALKCVGLRKSFDGVLALADVSLQFPPSGVIAIIGPNGAGKTTLINVMNGFLPSDAGAVFLGEQDLTYMSAHTIARLGIGRTFQDLRLISQVSVLENVMLCRPNQTGERFLPALFGFGVIAEEQANRSEALRLLQFTGLGEHAGTLAGELSYGQQKLLTLTCCLATGARILLLDEPVAGVHPEMASQILNLLQRLCVDGKLVIFIEHDIAFVRQVAESVIVMDKGKIIALGKPSEVLQLPEIIEAYVT